MICRTAGQIILPCSAWMTGTYANASREGERCIMRKTAKIGLWFNKRSAEYLWRHGQDLFQLYLEEVLGHAGILIQGLMMPIPLSPIIPISSSCARWREGRGSEPTGAVGPTGCDAHQLRWIESYGRPAGLYPVCHPGCGVWQSVGVKICARHSGSEGGNQ